MKINAPNLVTLSRLLLTIVFFALLGRFDARNPSTVLLDVCFWLFIVTALSDALDGYLARKLDQVTAFGRVVDPVVDKVLICGTFVYLVGPNFLDANHVNVTGVQVWMVVLIISRELLVTAIRGMSEANGVAFPASFAGKAKMMSQSIAVPTILCVLAHGDGDGWVSKVAWLKPATIWLAVVLTGYSLLAYLVRAKSLLGQMAKD